MKFNDVTKLFTDHANKWVALTDNKEVIASADTLGQVLTMARKKGHASPLTARIPDPNTEYVL